MEWLQWIVLIIVGAATTYALVGMSRLRNLEDILAGRADDLRSDVEDLKTDKSSTQDLEDLGIRVENLSSRLDEIHQEIWGEVNDLREEIADDQDGFMARYIGRYLRTHIETGPEDSTRGAVAIYTPPSNEERDIRTAARDFRDAIGGKFGSGRSGDQDDRPPVNFDTMLRVVWVPLQAGVEAPPIVAGLDLWGTRSMTHPVVISTGTRTTLGDRATGAEQWDGRVS